jgi:hypothetical protein
MAGTKANISWIFFFFFVGGTKFGCFFRTEKWDKFFHENKRAKKFATHIFRQKKEKEIQISIFYIIDSNM